MQESTLMTTDDLIFVQGSQKEALIFKLICNRLTEDFYVMLNDTNQAKGYKEMGEHGG